MRIWRGIAEFGTKPMQIRNGENKAFGEKISPGFEAAKTGGRVNRVAEASSVLDEAGEWFFTA